MSMINYASREINCQLERMEANVESMQNLYDNMAEYGYDLTKIPFVIQYNKRDLPNAAPIKDLQASLNPGWPIEDAARQKQTPDTAHPGESLVDKDAPCRASVSGARRPRWATPD